MTRGILATCYFDLKGSLAELHDAYREFYAGQPFTKVLDQSPTTKLASHSNLCLVNVAAQGQKAVVTGGARQPGQGRVGPGRGVLQHRLRLRPHDRAGDARPMAVTFARGFRAGTAACGIKAFTTGASAIPTGQRDDLCVIQSEHGCDTGGVFTTNKVKSASVVIDQLHLQHNRVRALTINSGNANACTGAQGFKDALLMAKLTADRLDLDPHQVLVELDRRDRSLPADGCDQDRHRRGVRAAQPRRRRERGARHHDHRHRAQDGAARGRHRRHDRSASAGCARARG